MAEDVIVTDSEGRVFEVNYNYDNKSFATVVVAYMPLPKPYKLKEEVNENETN